MQHGIQINVGHLQFGQTRFQGLFDVVDIHGLGGYGKFGPWHSRLLDGSPQLWLRVVHC